MKKPLRSLIQKSQMSIQKPLKNESQDKKVNLFKPVLKQTNNIEVIVSTVQSVRIHFSAKDAFGDGSDTSLLWKGNYIGPQNMRKKHIVFRNTQYMISNWTGDNFPEVIYLTVDNLAGYLDSSFTVTTRAAALQLENVAVVMDESDVRTYELKYVIRDPVTWEVPTTMNEFKVRVQIQQAPVLLPLPNPITINLQIRTE